MANTRSAVNPPYKGATTLTSGIAPGASFEIGNRNTMVCFRANSASGVEGRSSRHRRHRAQVDREWPKTRQQPYRTAVGSASDEFRLEAHAWRSGGTHQTRFAFARASEHASSLHREHQYPR